MYKNYFVRVLVNFVMLTVFFCSPIFSGETDYTSILAVTDDYAIYAEGIVWKIDSGEYAPSTVKYVEVNYKKIVDTITTYYVGHENQWLCDAGKYEVIKKNIASKNKTISFDVIGNMKDGDQEAAMPIKITYSVVSKGIKLKVKAKPDAKVKDMLERCIVNIRLTKDMYRGDTFIIDGEEYKYKLEVGSEYEELAAEPEFSEMIFSKNPERDFKIILVKGTHLRIRNTSFCYWIEVRADGDYEIELIFVLPTIVRELHKNIY